MADTVLKSVSIRNWNMVRETQLAFPERGLVLVRGINTAANGKMESIGSGKTSLGEALSRTLFGVKGRYTRLGDYSTHRKGDTYVKLVCEHKGKPLDVEMGFKCEELSPDGEGLRFSYNGEQVSRDRIDNTRADLTKLLTVSSDLANWTVYLDGDRLDFSALSERKAVEILMEALMQAPWTQFHQKANSTVTSLSRDKAKDQLALDGAQRILAEAKLELHTASTALAEAKENYRLELESQTDELARITEEIAATTTSITTTKDTMKDLKKEIERRTATNAEAEHKAEITFNEARDKVDQLMETTSEFLNSVTESRHKADDAQEKLNDMKNRGVCPTCKQKLPAIDKTKVAAQEKLVQKLLEEVATKSKASTKHSAALEQAKRKRAEARQKWQEIREVAPTDDLSKTYEGLEGELEQLTATLAELQQDKTRLEHGPDKSQVTRCEAVVTERRKQLKKAELGVNTAAQTLADTEETLRVAYYWQEAFGPTGIPNMVLRDAIAPLNATAKRISALMTGGTITVSYATSRQLASRKQEVAELVINVHNELGSHQIEGNSKGEGGLCELIVAETLAEVGGIANRIGYRWYDEVCPNHDEVVRRSVYAYLSEIAIRYNILVFLVSHSPEAANYADYTLIAEKTRQGTVYSWA